MLDYAKPAVFLSSCLQYIFSDFPYHSLIDKQGTNLQSRHERLKVLLQQVQRRKWNTSVELDQKISIFVAQFTLHKTQENTDGCGQRKAKCPVFP